MPDNKSYYEREIDQVGDNFKSMNIKLIAPSKETRWMHLNKESARSITIWLLSIYEELEG